MERKTEYEHVQEILKGAEAELMALRYCGYVKAAYMDISYALANQHRLKQEAEAEVLCEGTDGPEDTNGS